MATKLISADEIAEDLGPAEVEPRVIDASEIDEDMGPADEDTQRAKIQAKLRQAQIDEQALTRSGGVTPFTAAIGGAGKIVPGMDQIAGGVSALTKAPFSDQNFTDLYRDERDIYQRRREIAAEKYPNFALGGTVGSVGATLGPAVVDLIGTAPSALKAVASNPLSLLSRQAIGGAVKGAASTGLAAGAYGAADSEGDLTKGEYGKVASDAFDAATNPVALGLGATLGYGGGATGRALSRAEAKAATKANLTQKYVDYEGEQAAYPGKVEAAKAKAQNQDFNNQVERNQEIQRRQQLDQAARESTDAENLRREHERAARVQKAKEDQQLENMRREREAQAKAEEFNPKRPLKYLGMDDDATINRLGGFSKAQKRGTELVEAEGGQYFRDFERLTKAGDPVELASHYENLESQIGGEIGAARRDPKIAKALINPKTINAPVKDATKNFDPQIVRPLMKSLEIPKLGDPQTSGEKLFQLIDRVGEQAKFGGPLDEKRAVLRVIRRTLVNVAGSELVPLMPEAEQAKYIANLKRFGYVSDYGDAAEKAARNLVRENPAVDYRPQKIQKAIREEVPKLRREKYPKKQPAPLQVAPTIPEEIPQPAFAGTAEEELRAKDLLTPHKGPEQTLESVLGTAGYVAGAMGGEKVGAMSRFVGGRVGAMTGRTLAKLPVVRKWVASLQNPSAARFAAKSAKARAVLDRYEPALKQAMLAGPAAVESFLRKTRDEDPEFRQLILRAGDTPTGSIAQFGKR
jgi:hypothetical protein